MRNKVLTKEKLIEVAESIIKEEGLEACTLRNIAKHANCALGTLYNYFESRDVFLEQVFIQSWRNTNDKLLVISELDLPTNEKAYKMFRTIDEDIENRRGIGEYLFGSVFKNLSNKGYLNKPMESIIGILVNLLRESEKNKEYDDSAIRVMAEWIYYGSIVLRKKREDMEPFYRVTIAKFF